MARPPPTAVEDATRRGTSTTGGAPTATRPTSGGPKGLTSRGTAGPVASALGGAAATRAFIRPKRPTEASTAGPTSPPPAPRLEAARPAGPTPRATSRAHGGERGTARRAGAGPAGGRATTHAAGLTTPLRPTSWGATTGSATRCPEGGASASISTGLARAMVGPAISGGVAFLEAALAATPTTATLRDARGGIGARAFRRGPTVIKGARGAPTGGASMGAFTKQA